MKRSTFTLTSVLPFRKSVAIGVDIGVNALNLAKVSHVSEQKRVLLDFKSIPYDSSFSAGSPRFQQDLKVIMKDFCGATKKIEIWSTLSLSKAETHYLRIPKVAKNQVANAAYWTFKQETSLEDKDLVFDYSILGDVLEDGVEKTALMAYAASKREIHELKELFSRIGFPLTGITLFPFTFQNLLRTNWIENAKNDLLIFFIGMDWSRIDIFSQSNLMVSRSIKAGINSMVEAIRQRIERIEAEPSPSLPEEEYSHEVGSGEGKETSGSDLVFELLLKYIDKSIAQEKYDRMSDLVDKEVYEALQPVQERMIRQIEMTLKHYSLKCNNKTVERIYVCGEFPPPWPLVVQIGKQINLPAEILDPFSNAASDPKSVSERTPSAPSIGLALSHNLLTPNFLYNYEEKQRAATVRRIDKAVFSVSLSFMLICAGVFFWQDRLVEQKRIQASKLLSEMDQYRPKCDQNIILQQVAKIRNKQQIQKEYVERYLATAVISELTHLTPTEIRMLSLEINLGGAEEKQMGGQKRTLAIEGVVLGEPSRADSSLAQYLMRLKSSPIFRSSSIKERTLEAFENREALRFHVETELI
jgi:Tfp pilus assembly PilM family ATPase